MSEISPLARVLRHKSSIKYNIPPTYFAARTAIMCTQDTGTDRLNVQEMQTKGVKRSKDMVRCLSTQSKTATFKIQPSGADKLFRRLHRLVDQAMKAMKLYMSYNGLCIQNAWHKTSNKRSNT